MQHGCIIKAITSSIYPSVANYSIKTWQFSTSASGTFSTIIYTLFNQDLIQQIYKKWVWAKSSQTSPFIAFFLTHTIKWNQSFLWKHNITLINLANSHCASIFLKNIVHRTIVFGNVYYTTAKRSCTITLIWRTTLDEHEDFPKRVLYLK